MFSRTPRWKWWLMAPLVAILLILAYFRYSAVPFHDLDYQAWLTSHPEWRRGATDDAHANHWWVVGRARIDYIMSLDATPPYAGFVDFWREDADGVFLRFVVDYHTWIIYRYSTRDHKFTWKARWPISDS
jgi:hypothetical protein